MLPPEELVDSQHDIQHHVVSDDRFAGLLDRAQNVGESNYVVQSVHLIRSEPVVVVVFALRCHLEDGWVEVDGLRWVTMDRLTEMGKDDADRDG